MARTFRGAWACWAMAVAVQAVGATNVWAQARPVESEWPADSAAVHAVVLQFLTAFENLDWINFRVAFSDSATVFHPDGGHVSGAAGIDSSFRRVFAAIRAAAPGGPPYQRLEPQELEIRSLGQDAALVTFELRNGLRLGRRTLVLCREAGRWRIVHLHASNISVPSE